ncbi:hypothetical protein PBI_WOES_63 [Gordonia phage Woes]|uniref:Uncharacterized protein n=10 Tax=Woesvirus woes TaxID=1982751 RepID=A0A482JGZ1_9CAUD|nr:hypothetical protein BH793_gp50 [Gordonia phage Woes]ATW61158.1 hypothetical protein SEA_ANAMIKA_63 [Gordonia phage Anamika]AVP43247.1 hypothetical protein PBI_HAIL2PITT_62 [Gordonia phage Hail2Pitt]QAX94346.1 hypothetical protein SEA_GUILLAUME_63 [Gordonia phage Guillaume]QAX94669.1 hypothetical protein SEA_HARAMBE_63 [Gordonia phage Harambe]QAX95332.1 hypothetical protein SEA_HELLO_63 [Gordonia phage Hello]QAX95424.1 hypothetical protein SEA_NEOEVIE_63 [Gordonia phage Neoevie]QBP30340.1
MTTRYRHIKIKPGSSTTAGEKASHWYWSVHDSEGDPVGRGWGEYTPRHCIESVCRLFVSSKEIFYWTIIERDRQTQEVRSILFAARPHEAYSAYQKAR